MTHLKLFEEYNKDPIELLFNKLHIFFKSIIKENQDIFQINNIVATRGTGRIVRKLSITYNNPPNPNNPTIFKVETDEEYNGNVVYDDCILFFEYEDSIFQYLREYLLKEMNKYGLVNTDFMNWFRIFSEKLTINNVNSMSFEKGDYDIFSDTERFGL